VQGPVAATSSAWTPPRPSSSTAQKRPGAQPCRIRQDPRAAARDQRLTGGRDSPPARRRGSACLQPEARPMKFVKLCASPASRPSSSRPNSRSSGADRRRRPQRLRQVQSRRGPALGDGRELVQEHARLRHGRRHLRRLVRPPGPQHGRGHAHPRQQRPQAPPPASTTPTCSRSRAGSSARQARSTAINGKDVRARDVQLLFADARPAPARRRWCARARSAS
jgi:hypothetical protein